MKTKKAILRGLLRSKLLTNAKPPISPLVCHTAPDPLQHKTSKLAVSEWQERGVKSGGAAQTWDRYHRGQPMLSE